MLNFIRNLFRSPEQSKLAQFYETENKISSILASTDTVRLDYSESQKREGVHRAKLNAIQQANPDLQIADESVENIAAAKRLRKRKWFTVIIEAILAISAVKLFFSETINVNLSAGTAGSSGFAPLFWPVLLGLVVAYTVLNEAISYRIDDAKKETTGFAASWNKFSWFIPLLLIPFLNLYNILSHPGNPTNIIWLFFAVLSIWLNIKCAGYSKQFALMINTAIAMEKTRPEEDGLKKEEKLQARINRHMLEIKRQLMRPVADLKRLYLSFGDNKPELSLHPLYRMLLNNLYYLEQLLPIPEIVIVNPPVNMRDYQTFWEETTRVRIAANPIEENLPSVEQGSSALANDLENARVNQPTEREKVNESQPPLQNTTNAAPDFGDILSNENEIYV
jgi:hypothetical protein